MGRRGGLKPLVGPTRLSKVLEHLNSKPKLSLFHIQSLRLSYAYKNDHFGARHFVKEQLPKIRYANPSIKIEVQKSPKKPGEQWKPELGVQLEDGSTKTIDMDKKWSTSILKELMELGGGDPWRKWKISAKEEGIPLVKGEELERPTPPPVSGALPLPNLQSYREKHPLPPKEKKTKTEAGKKVSLDGGKKKNEKKKDDKTPLPPAVDLSNLTTKTGAAAVLP